MVISCAILIASAEAPDSPLLVKPTAYSPDFPFQLFGNGAFGNPFLEKNSLSYIKKIYIYIYISQLFKNRKIQS